MILLCISSCITKEKPVDNNQKNIHNTGNELLYATLYHQHAAERDALAYQAFNWARKIVQEDSKRMGNPRKTAIIIDIDETLLDNSPYQADGINKGYQYPEGWEEWMNLASCEPIPGALEFVLYAESSGCEVFYVTNRKERYRQPTLENLNNLGFPFADDKHLVMRTTSASKEERRNEIAEQYYILMLIGDNLEDFSMVFEGLNADERKSVVDSLRNEFGFRYIVLPNAMYGSWENAIIKKENTDGSRHEILRNALRGF